MERRQHICCHIRVRCMRLTLLGMPLPLDILQYIAFLACNRNDDTLLRKFHNMCYLFRNPLIREIVELDIS